LTNALTYSTWNTHACAMSTYYYTSSSNKQTPTRWSSWFLESCIAMVLNLHIMTTNYVVMLFLWGHHNPL
jgi:hypothetical protein